MSGKLSKLSKLKNASARMDTAEEIDIEQTLETAAFQSLDIDRISLNDANALYRTVQMEQEDIRILAEDIEKNGLLHNLVVSHRRGQNSEYVLISGERRLLALRLLCREALSSGADAAKWKYVGCKVLENLTPVQEEIFLDAANLQSRGGVGSEMVMRKACKRYVDNLIAFYHIDQPTADRLLKKISSQAPRSVERNLSIERKLLPELIALLDDHAVTRKEAESFLSLTGEEQQTVVKYLTAFRELDKQQKGIADTSAGEFKASALGALASSTAKERAESFSKAAQNAETALAQLRALAEQSHEEESGSFTAETKGQQFIRKNAILPVIRKLSRFAANGRAIKKVNSYSPEDKQFILDMLNELSAVITDIQEKLK